MTRAEYKQIAQQAIEQLVSAAEGRIGKSLPRRVCFGWIGEVNLEKIVADPDVAEFLTSVTFVDESHIWPCFDLFLERLLPDGRLLLMGYRAGFLPREYGSSAFAGNGTGHGAGQIGPFKLGCGHIVEQLLPGSA